MSLFTNRRLVTRLSYLLCLEKVNSFDVKASEFYSFAASNKSIILFGIIQTSRKDVTINVGHRVTY